MSSLTSIQSGASLRQTLAQLPRDARDTLFLLVVIAWVIAPQVPTLPVWTTLLAAGVLVWRGWLAWHSRPLPSRWISSGLLAPLAVAGTVFSHGTFVGREAGVTLVIALLALKTLELRARRDALVIFFLLIVGMFMETLAAIMILVPVMLPVAYQMGIDPIHFGIVMICTLSVGFQTPPLGENLFIASGISNVSIEEISLRALPFALAGTAAIFLIAVFPEIALWLPRAVGY